MPDICVFIRSVTILIWFGTSLYIFNSVVLFRVVFPPLSHRVLRCKAPWCHANKFVTAQQQFIVFLCGFSFMSAYIYLVKNVTNGDFSTKMYSIFEGVCFPSRTYENVVSIQALAKQLKKKCQRQFLRN